MNDRQIIERVSEVCDVKFVMEGDDCVEVSFYDDQYLLGGSLRNHPFRNWALHNVSLLTKLRSINLRKCQLGSAILASWDNQFQTTSLERIDLSCNNLLDVPRWVWRQYNLKELNLGANNLNGISTRIKDLPIEVLKLHKNKIDKTEIPLPPRLRVLNLYMCGLLTIPSYVMKMSTLESLAIGYSAVAMLPEFDKLPNLRWLTLANNHFEEIPESICNLEKLEFLVLAKNRLKELPESFGNLQALRSLSLYSNNLKFLPDSFGELQLSRLNVSANPFLSTAFITAKFKDIDFFRI